MYKQASLVSAIFSLPNPNSKMQSAIEVNDLSSNCTANDPVVINQFQKLIQKAIKTANKSQRFLPDIASELQKTLDIYIDTAEPELIITQYLIQKMKCLRDSNIKIEQANELVISFFTALTVPLNEPLLTEFKEIIKNIIQPSNQAIMVPNLWKDNLNNYDCYCQKREEDVKQQLCYKCGRRCHVDCFWPKEKTDKYFQCAVCFLTNCLPHKPVDEIFFLGYLQHDIREKVEYKLKFYVDMNRENINNVEIRCARLDHENRFQMTFPESCVLSISNKNLKELDPLPSTSPLKRRNDDEVHIDRYLITYLNTLSVHERHTNKKSNAPRHNHLMVVLSTTPRPIPRLLARSLQKQIMPHIQSKQFLKNYMKNSSHDCQIQKLNVSLRCQYYSTHIKYPARSIQCTTHYQPFDLYNFVHASLSAVASVQSWRCPICKKRAYDLVIDGYLLNLIEANRSAMDITFDNQGEPIFIQNEASESDTDENSNDDQDEETTHKDENNKEAKRMEDVIVKEANGERLQKRPLNKQQVNREATRQDRLLSSIIQIEDSDQEQYKLKRTLQDRDKNPQEDSQLLQNINKIPTPTQNQQPLLNGDSSKPKISTEQIEMHIETNIEDQIHWQAIKDKIISMQAHLINNLKPYSISTNNNGPSQNREINGSNHPLNKSISLKTHKERTNIDSEDQVIEDPEKKKNTIDLVLHHKRLLEKGKRYLSSRSLTEFDKLAFNQICRQLNGFKPY